MTSQKSLRNKVNLKDFGRSFGTGWIFPLVALIVLFSYFTLPIIEYVTADDFVSTKIHNEILVFITENMKYMFGFSFMTLGMVVCGMMTAIKQLNFLMSKKSVNVYLSMGISRTALFVNRAVSSLILLFISVFVPITISYIVNAVNFGNSHHLVGVYFYLLFSLFISSMAGYAIGSAATTISGNVFEAAVTSVSMASIVTLTAGFVKFLMEYLLRGFLSSVGEVRNEKWLDLLSPWTFTTNLQNDAIVGGTYHRTAKAETLLYLLKNETGDKNFKIPEYLNVDKGFVLPLVIWAVVSILILAFGLFLMKRRRAEHAKSFGKFKSSRAITATIAFIGATYFASVFLLDDIIGSKSIKMPIFVALILAALCGCLAFFIVEIIWTRKIKETGKSMILSAVLSVVFICTACVIHSEFFGTFNKLPNIDEIESVSVDSKNSIGFHNVQSYGFGNILKSSDKKDIKMVTELFEKLKDEAKASDSSSYDYVDFYFKEKNGKEYVRRMKIYTPETNLYYLETVTNSNFFDLILKRELLEKPDNDDFVTEINPYYPEESFAQCGKLRGDVINQQQWFLSDKSGIVSDVIEYITDDDKFYEALYNDLSKMTYRELVTNKNQPVYLLSRSYDYVAEVDDKMESEYNVYHNGILENVEELTEETLPFRFASGEIPVYPEMTETIKYLKEKGYKPNATYDGKIKEILYTDGKISAIDATKAYAENHKNEYKGYGTYNEFFAYDNSFYNDFDFYTSGQYAKASVEWIRFFMDSINIYDGVNLVYNDMKKPLKKAQADNFQSIMDSVRNQYMIYNDEGAYVYVIYDNGMIVRTYLPESKLSVLK